MKSIAIVIILLVLLGFLAYTNPTLDQYGDFVRDEIQDGVGQGSHVEKALGRVIGGLAGGVLTSATTRTDYLFFSVYDTDLGTDEVKCLGIVNTFFILEEPESNN
jgi:hypothetical protein